MQAILLMGIQASGKSTFCKQRFADSHVRINLDMLKTRHRERRLFETCLEIKQAFVIDNTNPTPADRQRYISLAKSSDFLIVGYYFESKLSEAIQRNQARPPEQIVPEKGLRATYNRLVLPQWEEGFDELYYVRLALEGGFSVARWNNEI